jgi:hypothetical protein
MMFLVYHQSSPDEIRRIAVLASIQRIQNFYFDANPPQVNYNANTVERVMFVMLDTPAARLTEAPLRPPMRLSDAYRKVVEQIRQTEAYLSARPDYDEPVVEEEDIRYPKLRDIDTRGIRGLRR